MEYFTMKTYWSHILRTYNLSFLAHSNIFCLVFERKIVLHNNPKYFMLILGNYQTWHIKHFELSWPHCCFYFQEINLFQCVDKESGCSWKFPLLHHWPKWKQSAHSRWTLWFPLPIPQTSQVWGLIHALCTPHTCRLWEIMRNLITM